MKTPIYKANSNKIKPTKLGLYFFLNYEATMQMPKLRAIQIKASLNTWCVSPTYSLNTTSLSANALSISLLLINVCFKQTFFFFFSFFFLTSLEAEEYN